MERAAEATCPANARARAALRCEYHLACIDGPDTGILIPLPAVLGRSQTLSLHDPSLSREHASISVIPGRHSRVEVCDLGSMNGTSVIHRGVARPLHSIRLHSTRPQRMRRGERLRCGADVFELRHRPPRLAKEKRQTRGRRWLMILPFRSLVVLGARFLAFSSSSSRLAVLFTNAILVCLLIGLVLFFLSWRRRRRALAPPDEAGTALHLAQMAASYSPRLPSGVPGHAGNAPFGPSGGRAFDEPIMIPLPGASRPWGIVPSASLDCGTPAAPRSIGVIGEGSLEDASRLAAGLLRRIGGGCLVLADGARKVFGSDNVIVEILEAGRPTPHRPKADAGLPHWRIVAAPSIRELPEWCEQIVSASGKPLSPLWWEQFGANDPESLLPPSLRLSELLHDVEASEPFHSLTAPLGVSAHGPLVLDLVADGPHALVAGTTGSGKSEALLTWIRGICARHSPQEVRFILFDYKGGSAFSPLAGLAHVDRVLTDLDASLSARALRALSALLRRREGELAELGLPDYAAWARAYEQGRVETIGPRIVIVIDEFRALIDWHEDGSRALVRLAAQGRSLGLHLIAATQRPAGAVSSEMRANLELRIALRCLSPADSMDVIASGAGAEIERIPGRAIIADRGIVQFAMSTGEEPVFTGGVPLKGGEEALAGCEGVTQGATWERPEPLPWVPLPPLAPGSRELLIAEGRARTSFSGSSRLPASGTVLGLGLVDGIDEGEHRLLQWDGGWVGLIAPRSEEELASRGAIALGARIAAAQNLPLHVCAPIPQLGQRGSSKREAGETITEHLARLRRDFGAASWIPSDEGADLALLFTEVKSACVLVIADVERSRRAMESAFGPLVAERLWSEGLDACAAASGVLVCAAPGARMNDPVLARCSMRFERPDPHAPQMRHMPSRQALGDERWVWKEGDALRILALVKLSSVKALCSPVAHRATGDSSLRDGRRGLSSRHASTPLVRTWEEAVCEFSAARGITKGREIIAPRDNSEAHEFTEAPESGKARRITADQFKEAAQSDKGARHRDEKAPTPASRANALSFEPFEILCGPKWLPLEDLLFKEDEPCQSASSFFDSPWVIEGDGGNLEHALIEIARKLGRNPPKIDNHGAESWTKPPPGAEVNWVLLCPSPERLRSLSRGAYPLPLPYSGRFSNENAGVARFQGQWTRIRVLPHQEGRDHFHRG